MKEIEEIIDILKDTDIYEFQWENSKRKIFLNRTTADEKVFNETREIFQNKSVDDKKREDISVRETKHIQIKSPMVGTFYGGPVNSGKSFVIRGSKIKKGQIIGIIEAMKVIKELPSETEGEIEKIHVENGQPVEYGQLLFSVIQPA